MTLAVLLVGCEKSPIEKRQANLEFSNVEYSYDEAAGKWTAGSPINVGGIPGLLYGYYPYCLLLP